MAKLLAGSTIDNKNIASENYVDNKITAATTLVAGTNVTLTQSGQNLVISSSGGGGGASSVAWGDVTDKPTSFPPSTHTHSEITDALNLTSIPGYNASVKQYLTHNSSGALRWENS